MSVKLQREHGTIAALLDQVPSSVQGMLVQAWDHPGTPGAVEELVEVCAKLAIENRDLKAGLEVTTAAVAKLVPLVERVSDLSRVVLTHDQALVAIARRLS